MPYRNLDANLSATNPDVREIEGFEATGRAVDLEGGLILAATLFWHNKNQNLLAALDMAVMGRATHMLRFINSIRTALKFPEIRGSSNVSAHFLEMPGFEQKVLEILEAAGLSPHHFIIELLENIGRISPRAMEALKYLAEAGVGISLDDFGEEKSEAMFDQLVEGGVGVFEVKFNGGTSRSLNEERVRNRCLELLNKAESAGIKRVVWEGHPDGISPEQIESIRSFIEAHKKTHPELAFVFEGRVIQDVS